MSLTFGAATSDRVNHGTGFANLAAFTAWCWVYPTTITNGRRFLGNIGGGAFAGWDLSFTGAGGALLWEINRATTPSSTKTSTALTTNSWWFLAATIDMAAGTVGRVFVGSLSAAVAEAGYSSNTNGSGAQKDDSANALIVGNIPGATSAIQGHIACAGVVNRVLTLGEMEQLQYRPRKLPGTLLLCNYGWNGTGTQRDLSGNGNDGTVTGATVGPFHVPVNL